MTSFGFEYLACVLFVAQSSLTVGALENQLFQFLSFYCYIQIVTQCNLFFLLRLKVWGRWEIRAPRISVTPLPLGP